MHRNTARRDLALVAAGTLGVAVLCLHFEIAERLLGWMRLHERWQVDELPFVLLALAAGLAWYALRRMRDARSELDRRCRAEAQLRAALAENRELALAAVRVQEDERRALARELHDEVGQHLNAAKLDAVRLRDAATESDPAAVRLVAALDQLEAVVRRIVGRLRPAGLDELGLAAALEECVDGWRHLLPAVDFRLSIDAPVEGFDEATNITIYRLVQEGLTNVAKHAHAASVEIFLDRGDSPREIVLSVRDDGVGTVRGTMRHGVGLIGMRERVEALAGRFEIATLAQGFGFVARWPVSGAPA